MEFTPSLIYILTESHIFLNIQSEAFIELLKINSSFGVSFLTSKGLYQVGNKLLLFKILTTFQLQEFFRQAQNQLLP